MQIVYRAANIIDANLVKNALEAEGIVVFVGGQYLSGAIGDLPPMPLVNVMVSESDIPRARTIARTLDAQLAEFREQPLSDADWLPEPV